jgi:transcription initiation factor TFIID subunit 2
MRKQQNSDLPVEDEFAQCQYILNQLKKHKSSFPFLTPVEPKRDGVLNYFDIIKEPMDLSTVEANLANNIYRSAAEFHAHINKIWANSYNFNEKGSLVHKLTVDMEKYYKSLMNSDGYKKSIKGEKQKARL